MLYGYITPATCYSILLYNLAELERYGERHISTCNFGVAHEKQQTARTKDNKSRQKIKCMVLEQKESRIFFHLTEESCCKQKLLLCDTYLPLLI